ncbi:MAG: hypothetical protein JW787_10965 [Sedimentisphaerales bacterium]|nr:hypothetical protein [Sedimentisphaerales bacterium]
MKLQYLGDSKDSFKWDYHDYLLKELGYQVFNIIFMMTPDDISNDGKSHPALFPARKKIIEFCHYLRSGRNIRLLFELPHRTGSDYIVNLHKPEMILTNTNRKIYFSGLAKKQKQFLFLDPDNGFEPKHSNEKHILFSDIVNILEQITEDSVISVFQHFRRVTFQKDFEKIKNKLLNCYSCYSTAIYWNFLMFICLSKSQSSINKVLYANIKYSKLKPTKIIT